MKMTMQNTQGQTHNDEDVLINQYKQFQQNVSEIQNKQSILQYQLKEKSSQLSQAQAHAQENFGTSDIVELRNLYQSNINHNKTVVPKALEESAIQLQRINDVLNNLGIQQ